MTADNEPDILAMVAASAALTISGVPFMGPIGAARVGYIDGEYILNPTDAQVAEGDLDLVVAATYDAVMMVEIRSQRAVGRGHARRRAVRARRLQGSRQGDRQACRTGCQGSVGRGRVGRQCRVSRTSSRSSIGKDIAAAYKLTDKSARSNALNEARAKAKAQFAEDGLAPQEVMAGIKLDQEARSRNRSRRHPQGRQAHRRPHDDADPSDRRRNALPPARARLGAVHPRRDRRRSRPVPSAPRMRSR